MYSTNNNQQSFIRQAIKHSIRTDGRTNNQYRKPYIKTNIINQANASVSVSFEFSQISFYVTIKLLIVKQTKPSIVLNIDSIMRKQDEDNTLEVMKNILTNHYINNINTDDFVIAKSKSCLKVFVDVLLLSYPHFNLMSTISTGIVSAFSTLQIPITKALINEITGEEQIEVQEKFKSFSGKLPTLIVVGQAEGQLVCDMTSEQYQSMDFIMLIVLDSNDSIYGIHQLKGVLDPEATQKIIRFAQKVEQGLSIRNN